MTHLVKGGRRKSDGRREGIRDAQRFSVSDTSERR
jgi:hypothetical protein